MQTQLILFFLLKYKIIILLYIGRRGSELNHPHGAKLSSILRRLQSNIPVIADAQNLVFLWILYKHDEYDHNNKALLRRSLNRILFALLIWAKH